MQTTFPRLLLQHAAERPDAPAMREKEYGIWQAHSWAALSTLVQHIACGLHQSGLKRGEHMVLIAATARACTPPCSPRSLWAQFRYLSTRTR